MEEMLQSFLNVKIQYIFPFYPYTCYENVDERHECPPPVEHREGADKEQGEEDVEHEQQVGHRVRNSAVKELLSPEIEYYQKMGQPR